MNRPQTPPHAAVMPGLSRRQAALALAGCAVGAVTPQALAQFRVEVLGVGARRLPVAVPAWAGEEQSPEPLSDIIRSDLARCGSFAPATGPAGLDERSDPPATGLADATALLTGSSLRLADGTYALRYRLWDLTGRRAWFLRAAEARAADLRRAAHQVADEVHEALLGAPGAFATRLAYVAQRPGQTLLNTADADGEGTKAALISREPIISPAWSPDGRHLAYVSFETRKAVVWVQAVISGERRRVADFRGSNSAPAWAPDGRELVVTLSRDGPSQLYRLPLDGGAPRRLTDSNGIDTEAAFSTDGRWLYFVSDRGGGPQIYRMPADGGRAERITRQGAYNTSPAPSPDGQQLAFIARDAGAFRLTVMDLSSGTQQVLTDTVQDRHPSFAPNGRLLVYATRVQGQHVLMTTTLDGGTRSLLASSSAEMREPAWGPYPPR